MLENKNYELFREFVEEMEEANQVTNQNRDAFYDAYVQYCKDYMKKSVWEWSDEEIIYDEIVFWHELAMSCSYVLVDNKIVAKFEE